MKGIPKYKGEGVLPLLPKVRRKVAAAAKWTGPVVPGLEGVWEGAGGMTRCYSGFWGSAGGTGPLTHAFLSLSFYLQSTSRAQDLCWVLRRGPASSRNRACGKVRGQTFGSGEPVWESGEGFPEEVAGSKQRQAT